MPGPPQNSLNNVLLNIKYSRCRMRRMVLDILNQQLFFSLSCFNKITRTYHQEWISADSFCTHCQETTVTLAALENIVYIVRLFIST